MRQLDFRSEDPGTYSLNSYHLFSESLEGTAIAAGIPPPELRVVNLATANALTFEAAGKPVVGVTSGLLEAGFTQHEVEAVMAHQVAHITLNSGLKAPLFIKLRTIVILVFSMLLIPLILAVIFNNGDLLFLSLLIFFIFVLPAWLDLVVNPYLPWRRLSYYKATGGGLTIWQNFGFSTPSVLNPSETVHEEDLVADSIAAKMTSNPVALKDAIIKMTALMDAATKMPTQTITFPHLFIGPLQAWDAPRPTGLAYIFRYYKLPLGAPVPSEDLVKEEIKAFARLQEYLLEERIENLNAISHGEWRIFEEVRCGKVRTSPKGWE